MESSHLVFVYGTLRQSHANHQLLKDSKYYGTGVTRGNYAMYIAGGYPYVVVSESRYPIVGELYAVGPETLARLDKMEGHPHYFNRREIPVTVEGCEYSAWMYIRSPQGVLVPGGDYNDALHCR
jgi:gamma-glutamylaminecyclotransferase